MLECAAATTGVEASLTCQNPDQTVTEFATGSGDTLFSETCIPADATDETFFGLAYFQFEAVIPEVSKYQ